MPLSKTAQLDHSFMTQRSGCCHASHLTPHGSCHDTCRLCGLGQLLPAPCSSYCRCNCPCAGWHDATHRCSSCGDTCRYEHSIHHGNSHSGGCSMLTVSSPPAATAKSTAPEAPMLGSTWGTWARLACPPGTSPGQQRTDPGHCRTGANPGQPRSGLCHL